VRTNKAECISRPNARFWTFLNGGWVKLTLPPGVCLTWWRGGPCDEGSYFQAIRWEHEDGVVVEEFDEWGQDCDGRHSRYSSRSCPVTELRCVNYELSDEEAGISRPNWLTMNSSQRDYTAEAAGY
jgi:hypothetical protein